MTHSQSGTSLIEILISIIILSILLLGVDAMQITTLQKAKTNYYFAVAIQQLDILKERLKLQKKDVSLLLEEWNKQNQVVLPQGRGVIEGDFPQYELTIFWGSKNASECKKNKIAKIGCIHSH